MTFIIALLLLLAQASSLCASDCTKHGSVSTSSVAVESANDVAGPNGVSPGGRHYFEIVNSGGVNTMYVAIGSSNNATTQDVPVAPGAAWIMWQNSGAMVPGGDVAVISTGTGTNWAYCDY